MGPSVYTVLVAMVEDMFYATRGGCCANAKVLPPHAEPSWLAPARLRLRLSCANANNVYMFFIRVI